MPEIETMFSVRHSSPSFATLSSLSPMMNSREAIARCLRLCRESMFGVMIFCGPLSSSTLYTEFISRLFSDISVLGKSFVKWWPT